MITIVTHVSSCYATHRFFNKVLICINFLKFLINDFITVKLGGNVYIGLMSICSIFRLSWSGLQRSFDEM